jgi:hypothetical protein
MLIGRPGRADPKVNNLRNTKIRAILIVILHFYNPQATSDLSKIISIIFDIICNPTTLFWPLQHLRPYFGLFSKFVIFLIQID